MFRNESEMKNGVYKEIFFGIKKWRPVNSYKGNEIWNYYVYIPLDRLTEKAQSYFQKAEQMISYGKFTAYDYTELNKIVPMHGGITYMSIEYHPRKYYKLGCDYNHLGDEYLIKDWDTILADVKETIDALYDNGIINSEGD